MASNVDHLWELSTRKQQLVLQIENLRGDFLKELSANGISHEMPASDFQLSAIMALIPKGTSRRLHKYLTVLGRLKREIQSLAADNRQFVEEYLSTLNELASIFTGGQKPAPTYAPTTYGTKREQTNALLHREV
jgi:hypothetical protein